MNNEYYFILKNIFKKAYAKLGAVGQDLLFLIVVKLV